MHGVQDFVHFAGEMRDMPAVYRDLDVFALSSLYEGTSMSILEAMATGLCVVATNVGGNPDLVGDTGILCRSGDADSLALALEAALDVHRRTQRGRAARARIVASYSEERVLARYEEDMYGIARLAPAIANC
jgi:glycosyltransferase involved in cell wall biosynthesis